MLKYIYSLSILVLACGTPGYDIDKNAYEPKIVIEGILIPNESVHRIKITRNFPIQGTIDKSLLAIKNADVRIKDIATGSTVILTYDAGLNTFVFYDTALSVAFNKSYRLEVNATIDGTLLEASSETTVPTIGFKIDSLDRTITKFRELDANRNIKPLDIHVKLSPNAQIYVVAQYALTADTSNFIYDNPYFNLSRTEILKNLSSFQYQTWEFENLKGSIGRLPLQWWGINFYSEYRVNVYAGDKNYKDFFLTYESVQDIDGTLSEPVFHIEGDGIGIFGSAIVDSLTYQVVR